MRAPHFPALSPGRPWGLRWGSIKQPTHLTHLLHHPHQLSTSWEEKGADRAAGPAEIHPNMTQQGSPQGSRQTEWKGPLPWAGEQGRALESPAPPQAPQQPSLTPPSTHLHNNYNYNSLVRIPFFLPRLLAGTGHFWEERMSRRGKKPHFLSL